MENHQVEGSWEDWFGRRVRAEREARGWTQADLARKISDLGVKLHPSAIAKIELRDVARPRVIRLDEARAIAEVFELSIDEMTETSDHVVRYLGNRMRVWTRNLVAQLEEGRMLDQELTLLLAGTSDEEERARLKETLASEEFSYLTHFSWGTAQAVLEKLFHPERRSAIDWPHQAAQVDSET